ncbi:hypothetical protein NC652_027417 [Populus alba x Populus x berolinensis]|nr:hypothetical protein NC652_027417 [Populus alba x Populus x berolinensis]
MRRLMYPLVLIAMYNVLDLISRYIPLVPYLKLESRNGLLVAVLSRFYSFLHSTSLLITVIKDG